jgi:hypothetical protein
VPGRDGNSRHARLRMSLIRRHDTGKLSDHEQADQYRNESPKAPKPLHSDSSAWGKCGRDPVARQSPHPSSRRGPCRPWDGLREHRSLKLGTRPHMPRHMPR